MLWFGSFNLLVGRLCIILFEHLTRVLKRFFIRKDVRDT